MNGFYQFAETSTTECKLSEIANESPGKSLDYCELDKPIATKSDAPAKVNVDGGINETTLKRELTDDERSYYKEKLNCSDAQLDKMEIDENNKLYLKTINEGKEGTEGEGGVKYERKTVLVNGIEIEGVFPVFDSAFDTELPNDLLKATDAKQEKYCNDKLKEAVGDDSKVADKFTPEQIEQIENGDTPDGYTWHHNEETGKMQLVKTYDHQANRHTGGIAIWGGGQESR